MRSQPPCVDPPRWKHTQFVADLIGREVVVTTRVDEDILGGLVIQIGDRLMDEAQTRLNGSRERLNTGSARAAPKMNTTGVYRGVNPVCSYRLYFHCRN